MSNAKATKPKPAKLRLRIVLNEGKQRWEMDESRVSHDERAFVFALMRGVHLLPAALVLKVRAEVARAVEPPTVASVRPKASKSKK